MGRSGSLSFFEAYIVLILNRYTFTITKRTKEAIQTPIEGLNIAGFNYVLGISIYKKLEINVRYPSPLWK